MNRVILSDNTNRKVPSLLANKSFNFIIPKVLYVCYLTEYSLHLSEGRTIITLILWMRKPENRDFREVNDLPKATVLSGRL